MMTLREFQSRAGKIGGKSRSQAKVEAARQNAAKARAAKAKATPKQQAGLQAQSMPQPVNERN